MSYLHYLYNPESPSISKLEPIDCISMETMLTMQNPSSKRDGRRLSRCPRLRMPRIAASMETFTCQTAGAAALYGTLSQNEAATTGSQRAFSYRPGSIPMGLYALQMENIFPERPDQPECQFYMKTGDCKFGAVCKFHHPRDRLLHAPNCILNPLGRPIRPGSWDVCSADFEN